MAVTIYSNLEMLDSATAACQALRRLAPDPCDEHLLILRGHAAELVTARKARPPTEPVEMLILAEAQARTGDTAVARRQLAAALATSRTRYVREDYVAAAYLALGDTARTLEWLERGLDAQAANLAQINRAWRFKPLHGNPRFAAILRKVGLRLWP
jgi:tetratricopeptide (TPR) repeat protein